MKISDPHQAALFGLLSRLAREVGRDATLLANPVVAKNTQASSLLETWLSGHADPPGFWATLGLLARYCLDSLAWLAVYGLSGLLFAWLRPPVPRPTKGRERIFIDVYFLVEQMARLGRFEDHFLPGLAEELSRRGFVHLYAPSLYGLRPRALVAALRAAAGQGVPAIFEFHLLRWSDYLRLLLFVPAYAAKVLTLAWRQDSSTFEGAYLRDRLLRSLAVSPLDCHARYLFGRRLGRLAGDIRLIGWYENQALHKCFYLGLRRGARRVVIHGAQLFVWAPSLLNIHPDPAEVPLGLVPDKVVVNGPLYLDEESPVPQAVGPALRYRRVFEPAATPSGARRPLWLLPYDPGKTRRLLHLLRELPAAAQDAYIKFHPSTRSQGFRDLLPRTSRVVDGDLHDILPAISVVIGVESGGLAESLARSVPVVVPDVDGCDNNPLVALGRGRIWDTAATPDELLERLERLAPVVASRQPEVQALFAAYRDLYFTDPTARVMGEAFDLDRGFEDIAPRP